MPPFLSNLPSEKTEALTSVFSQFYQWKNYNCAYEIHQPVNINSEETPLLLIHPIGVGLSRKFWSRFCHSWYAQGCQNPIYNPDLLGCGESEMPTVAYYPIDWAQQLQYFLETVVQKPVIIIVQGALFTIALELVKLLQEKESNLIKALIVAGPPAWTIISDDSNPLANKISWNLFNSLLGSAFYRYARRYQFLKSFSTRQLFATEESVDNEWLETLENGAKDMESRHAVFSFLAGFWRQNYRDLIESITQPTLIVVGAKASNISKKGKGETPEEKLEEYLRHFPKGQGLMIKGRNVLPYESTSEFVTIVAEFVREFH